MNEMIERVAKAIWDNKCLAFHHLPEWQYVTDSIRNDYLSNAKAAIAAMREPTDDMKIAGIINPGAGGPDEDYETEVWQTMIDEALKDD